jgi:acetylornithine deacetylase
MISDQEKAVLRLIDQHQQELVQLLQKLISYKTITPGEGGGAQGDDYRDLQALLSAYLVREGFDVESWEIAATDLETFPGSGVDPNRDMANMPVLVGQRTGAGQGRSLILNGHYDVVPPGIVENWHHDPFGGQVEDGRIYGRGAADMKGGIAAMLSALRWIRKAGLQLAGDLIVQTVPDEEATCMGTLSCCQRGYKADAALIPEPTGLNVLVAMRGSLWGRITVPGRAGHAEMAQPHWQEGGAVNAISKAILVLQGLESLAEEWRTRPDRQHKYLDPDTIVPTVIQGGEWQVTYPEQVAISFGAMFTPGTMDSRDQIAAQLRRVAELDPWLREHPPVLETDEWHYGAEVDGDEPIVLTGLQVLGDLGVEPDLIGIGSLTDAVHLINFAGIPTISVGPGGETAHSADEHVEIESLVTATKAIALCVMRWCGVAA